jgi:uncharacterized protein
MGAPWIAPQRSTLVSRPGQGHPKFVGTRSDNGAMPTVRPEPPLAEPDIERLQSLLDALPAPLEPLDVSALDGYLVGVLLQPHPLASARWLAHVHDLDARPAPPGVTLEPLHALVRRRHGELERSIAARQWFDPWIFELAAAPGEAAPRPSDMVLPWVGGFAAALDLFAELLAHPGMAQHAGREPLAVLYSHFDPEDLEDADDLLPLIDELEPAATLADAVEDLVRCALLLADVTRPRPTRRPVRRRT